MGGHWMFEDERLVPDGHHDNVDNVAVPSKTMGLYCNNVGTSQPGIFADHGRHTGAHSGGANFMFSDGHAATYNIEVFRDWWVATGGSNRGLLPDGSCPGEPYGDYAYTYPPDLNVEGSVASAEWWIPPYYPDGPIYSYN